MAKRHQVWKTSLEVSLEEGVESTMSRGYKLRNYCFPTYDIKTFAHFNPGP